MRFHLSSDGLSRPLIPSIHRYPFCQDIPEHLRAPFTGFASPWVAWCSGVLESLASMLVPPWHGHGTYGMYEHRHALGHRHGPYRCAMRCPYNAALPVLRRSPSGHTAAVPRGSRHCLGLAGSSQHCPDGSVRPYSHARPVSPCLCSAVAIHISEGSSHGPSPPECIGAFLQRLITTTTSVIRTRVGHLT